MSCNETKNAYVQMPFCSKTATVDFYTYCTVADIINKNGNNLEKTFKCRTVGVLESINGQYYLSDFRKASSEKLVKLKVSMCYVKSPLQSSVKPYPVQIFGTIQWKKEPILYAMILQVLAIRAAVKVGDIMTRIAQNLLAKEKVPETSNDEHG